MLFEALRIREIRIIVTAIVEYCGDHEVAANSWIAGLELLYCSFFVIVLKEFCNSYAFFWERGGRIIL